MKAGDAAYFCALRPLIQADARLRGDVILTYVAGELQGGIGTAALIEQGVCADYFVNSEPTDLAALTMHAAAFVFTIELIGKTRHMSPGDRPRHRNRRRDRTAVFPTECLGVPAGPGIRASKR
jgi:acetylornithine deacetylase